MSEYVQMYPNGSHSPIRCPYPACPTQVAKFEDWLAHVRTHVTDGSDDTACPWIGCDRTYKTEDYLYEHVKSHIGFKDRMCPHLTDSRPRNRVRCSYSTSYRGELGKHRKFDHGWDTKSGDSIDPYVKHMSQNIEHVILFGGNIQKGQVSKGDDGDDSDGDDGDDSSDFVPEEIRDEPQNVDASGPGIGVQGNGAPPAAMPMGGPGIPGPAAPAGPMHNSFGQNLPRVNLVLMMPAGELAAPRLAYYITVCRVRIDYIPRICYQRWLNGRDRWVYRRVFCYIRRRRVFYTNHLVVL